jgi:hypothetical protein
MCKKLFKKYNNLKFHHLQLFNKKYYNPNLYLNLSHLSLSLNLSHLSLSLNHNLQNLNGHKIKQKLVHRFLQI